MCELMLIMTQLSGILWLFMNVPRTKKILCWFLAAGIVVAIQAARADVVYLKNGKKIEGKIVKETDRQVLLELPIGQLGVNRSDIRHIERKEYVIEKPVAEKAAALPAPEPESAPQAAVPEEAVVAVETTESTETAVPSDIYRAPSNQAKTMASPSMEPEKEMVSVRPGSVPSFMEKLLPIKEEVIAMGTRVLAGENYASGGRGEEKDFKVLLIEHMRGLFSDDEEVRSQAIAGLTSVGTVIASSFVANPLTFAKVIILFGCIYLLLHSGNSWLCAGIYTFSIWIVALLSGYGFGYTAVFTVIRYIVAFIYFALLSGTQGTILRWLILPLGIIPMLLI